MRPNCDSQKTIDPRSLQMRSNTRKMSLHIPDPFVMTILPNDFALLLHLNFAGCSGYQRNHRIANGNRIGLRPEPPSFDLEGLRLDVGEVMS